ncbi:MAG: helix-turn-helix domain-containing protein, partial [Verrucomicrobiota bacterium]
SLAVSFSSLYPQILLQSRKEFRQDLFFRLNVVPILVPPLRDRREDVPQLVEQFMQRYSRKHGVRIQGISPACRAVLQNHSWPGNVRELQNVIERAVILCGEGGELEIEHLGFVPGPGVFSAPAPSVAGPAVTVPAAGPAAASASGFTSLGELEKQHIFAALEQTKGNRTQAAKLLGISIRTLRNKLHEYGVGGREETGAAEEAAEAQ